LTLRRRTAWIAQLSAQVLYFRNRGEFVSPKWPDDPNGGRLRNKKPGAVSRRA
jgi:hypothetical protein